jgi:g-D-glutamyl-meso-diaminopimelate peptidase
MEELTRSKREYIQSTLRKLGYYPGNIDAIFGPLTESAIQNFQQNENLPTTGEIDASTLVAMEKYFLGFDIYTIEEGDTLFNIARQFNTTVQAIIDANPDINPFVLDIGTDIVVPFNYNIVPTDVSYTYEILEYNLEGLQRRHPYLHLDIIGVSVDNRNIYRIRIGDGPQQVSYNGSHHANEWITTPLLMSWLENFLYVFSLEGSIRGYDTQDIWEQSTIDLVPMVNPDGVELVVNGRHQITVNQNELLEWNNYSEDFSRWKANVNGVDLNRNYDAGFDEYKTIETEFGVDGPGPALYAGPYPGSEPESLAMIQLTRVNNYRLVLAFHTQGQVIFWHYRDLQPEESYVIGMAFSDVTGYPLATPDLSQSFAGYKDWFIEAFGRPGYTIEVGRGVNPLPIEQFPMIYENNEELMLLASII